MPEEHTLSLGTWEGGLPAGDGGKGEGLGDAMERKSEAARTTRTSQVLYEQ